MAWEVEYTDEFESWWIGLNEEEQIDIDAVVGLLEARGRICLTPTARTSSMPLILAEQPFCLLAVGKPEGKVGTKNMSH